MKQVLIFLAVAVLTFLSGVALQRLLATASHPQAKGSTQVVARAEPTSTSRGVGRISPVISLDEEADCPVKLLAGATVGESEPSHVVKTTFYLRQMDHQPVHACQVGYEYVVGGAKGKDR